MLNRDRHRHYLELMAERGWDLLLFYGDNWRKDMFRCLVNVNFQGPQAVAALFKSGEVRRHRHRSLGSRASGGRGEWQASTGCTARRRTGRTACEGAGGGRGHQRHGAYGGALRAGSARLPSRRLRCPRRSISRRFRRVKTPEEIDWIRQAATLADRGYQQFVKVCEPGMTEYELVAEVEAFVKANGAEDNFMLVASGGTEVTGMKPPTGREVPDRRLRHHRTHPADQRLLRPDLPHAGDRRTQ